jgi:hypothetical protein
LSPCVSINISPRWGSNRSSFFYKKYNNLRRNTKALARGSPKTFLIQHSKKASPKRHIFHSLLQLNIYSMKKSFYSGLMTLGLSCLLWLTFSANAEAQTISVGGAGYCGNSQTNAIRQNQELILSITPPTVATTCTPTTINYTWKHNGIILTTSTTPNYTISNFSSTNIGVYTVDIVVAGTGTACPAAVTSPPRAIMMAPNPDLEVATPINGLCEPPTSALVTLDALSFFSAVPCPTCDSYEWVFDDLSGSTYPLTPYTSSNLSVDYTTLNVGLGSVLDFPQASIPLYLRATDIYGCEWQADPVNVPIVRPSMTAYTAPPGVQIPLAGPVDLLGTTNVAWISPYSNSTPHTFSLVSGSGLLSGDEFYPFVAGSNTIRVATTEHGCTYSAENTLDVTPTANISFNNATAATTLSTSLATTINGNVEACAGDEIVFNYIGNGVPTFVRMAGQDGTYIVTRLDDCIGALNTCVLRNTALADTLTNDSIGTIPTFLNPSIGYNNTSSSPNIIRIAVPRNAATGPVCFYDSDPTTTVVPVALGCISAPGNLTVNNPQTGFALVKQPMCYSDEALLIGIPAGGAFSATQAQINLDTTGGLPIRFSGVFSALDTNLTKIDSLGRTFLVGSAITTAAGINDGGQMVAIKYEYQPTYTNGESCPNKISVFDTVPVFDNRGISFGFPLIEYAANATPINLNSRVNSISPALNGGDFNILTSRFADTLNSFVFSGTFVQQNSTSPSQYDFLVAQAGINRHPVTLTINNNGCSIQGNGFINLLPKPEFVNLPGAMCRSLGTKDFMRDPSLYRTTRRDTIVTCTPINYQVSTSISITPPRALRPLMPTLDISMTNNDALLDLGVGSERDSSGTTAEGGDGADSPTRAQRGARPNSANLGNIQGVNLHLFTPEYLSFAGQQTKILPASTPFSFCRPTQIIETTANEFAYLQARDTISDTLAHIPRTGPGVIAPGALNFTNPDNSASEFFTLNLASAAFGAPHRLITVDATFQTTQNIYPVDSSSGKGTSTAPYVIHRLDTAGLVVNVTYRSIVQDVELINQSFIRIDTLGDVFCYNAPEVRVGSTPAFEPGFSGFSVRQIVPIDPTNTVITLTENILDIAALSDTSTVNKIYEITYKYTKFFGCDSIAKDTFTIIASQPAFFTGSSIGNSPFICINSGEELLNGSPLPNSGLGGSFSGNGIGVDNQGNVIVNAQGDTIRNVFSPARAGLGTHRITYTYTDLNGCQSIGSRFITVRSAPNVSLTVSRPSAVYCASETGAVLIGAPDTNITVGTGRYFGPTIVGDNIFHPNLAFLIDSSAASGGIPVYYSYRDTFGCADTAVLEISIQPLPVLSFVGLGSRYCQNSAVITNITATDLTGIAYSSARFRGDGILGSATFNNPQARLANYSPSQAGIGLDTVWYIHSNIYGCTDSIFREIQIDSAPRPVINNLASFYCINTPVFTLSASPSGVSSQFLGAGVANNSGNFSFSPNTAANSAGVNQNIIVTYSFTDANGCVGISRDTTIIRALPTATMNIPNSFCENSPAYTIPITLGGSVASHTFSGQSLSNTTLGIISPPLGVSNAGYGLTSVNILVTDTVGCVNTISNSFALNPKPNVVITGIDSMHSACTNAPIFTVSGFPSGTTGFLSTTIPTASNAFNLVSSSSATILPNASLTGNTYDIVYRYTDVNNCSDTTQKTITFLAPPNPSISQLNTQYCENSIAYNIVGTPAGANNFFSGAGISLDTANSQWLFNPFRSGSGAHTITYSATNTYGALACTQTISQVVNVRPLPVPTITSPANNTAFCNTDQRIRISGTISNLPTFLDSAFVGSGIQDSQIFRTVNIPPFGNVLVADTIFFFNPQTANIGNNRITFTATNTFGCVDSVRHDYFIYESPATSFSIDSAFCESSPNVVLVGTPATGQFTLRGNILAGGLYRPNPLYPNTLLSAPQFDTIIYTVNTGNVCITRDTNTTVVYPVPRPSYFSLNMRGDTTDLTCLNIDSLRLIPNLQGGTFSGSGVLFGGTQFLPNIAGVGRHSVQYLYADPITGCSNSYFDTFYVYSTPVIDFEAIGGCGNQAIIMNPDNNLLGLNGFFAGTLYDSITQISWNFGDGNTRQELPLPNNQVDSVHHLYANYGIYNVSLFVENRGYCGTSDTLRVVVSPQATPTALAPYFEDFEASNGGWLEESEIGNQSSDLWAWDIAAGNNINTNNDPHNFVWVTNPSGAYGQNASGWVYSPCFDLSQLDRPMVSLDYFSNTDEGNDGVVVEYYNETTNTWLPLGSVGRGLGWYDNSVIAGRPGLQDLAPIGWSGEMNRWNNGRFPLDPFRSYQNFRFRIAFGAVGVHNRGLEGFAFDEVFIGNRQRNVLLEHFANANYNNMDNINQHVYNLCFGTNLVRDVILVQYQTQFPAADEHNSLNPIPAASRALRYGLGQPARAIIDGLGYASNSPQSMLLSANNFEANMLATPIFDIRIDSFQVLGNQASMKTIITANKDLDMEEYIAHTLILEDSVDYLQSSNTQIQSVVRDMLPNASGVRLNRAWATAEQEILRPIWTFDPNTYNPSRLQAVVFVQNQITSQVYQAASTRDISIFLNGLGTAVAPPMQAQTNETQSARLYPNPTQDAFRVDFDQPLSQTYDWTLVDVHGRTLQNGKAQAGSQGIDINTYDLAAGAYFFVIRSSQVITQRQVIIYRP